MNFLLKTHLAACGFLLLIVCSEEAGAEEKNNYASLIGIWAEDCSTTGRAVIITPEYHAVIYGLKAERAVGLGKIEQFMRVGENVTVFLSTQFLHEKGEPTPKYRIAAKNKILSVRNREFWAKSENAYRDSPALRPVNYVDLGDAEYGVVYNLCSRDKRLVDRRMRELIEAGSYELENH